MAGTAQPLRRVLFENENSPSAAAAAPTLTITPALSPASNAPSLPSPLASTPSPYAASVCSPTYTTTAASCTSPLSLLSSKLDSLALVAPSSSSTTSGAAPAPTALPSASSPHDHPHVAPTYSDFDVLKQISNGAFGVVYLVRRKNTRELYAMKIMKKELLRRKNMIHQAVTERDALARINNPFIVRLLYSFRSPQALCLVMDYMIGGDLSSLLRAFGYFDESMAAFYLAEMNLALEYLHSRGVVHRDIKPDNVLIDSRGHIKLSDFGLSRIDSSLSLTSPDSACGRTPGQVQSLHSDFAVSVLRPTFRSERSPPSLEDLASPRPPSASSLSPTTTARMPLCTPRTTHRRGRTSLVGTPDYLAPELLRGGEHGAAVDMWALGVCAFELMTGTPPFNDDSKELVFEHILRRDIPWPMGESGHCLSASAVSLIDGLLAELPTVRPAANTLKAHGFFSHVAWENMLASEAPFVPQPSSETDTGYFDATMRTKLSVVIE